MTNLLFSPVKQKHIMVIIPTLFYIKGSIWLLNIVKINILW